MAFLLFLAIIPGIITFSNAESLHHLFLELKQQFNQTFVIVTHNEKLAELSDRMVKLKDGQIEFIKEIIH
jgi:lipoprotein-releasing system ATP-binding protein